MRNRIALYRARELRNAATDTERYLWRYLKGQQLNGYKFRRQVPIENYILDFACLAMKVVVELDGGQHQAQSRYDERRGNFLRERGFTVLRFWDNDVLKNTSAVLDVILRALNAANAPSHTLPRKQGRDNGSSSNE